MSFQESESNLRIGKDSAEKSQQTIHSVCNYNPYATPHVKPIDLELCQISDPYEVIRAAPVRTVGG